MKKKFLEAGKIVNTHGVKGEVVLEPWADSAEFLKTFKTFYIGGAPRAVVSSRVHKQRLILLLEGVEDVVGAMRLKGEVIFIDRDDAPLGEGEFFIQDIVGAEVFSDDGELLGELYDFIEQPWGRIYLIRGEREYMIPAVPEFILSTDPDAGKIVVHLIEGM